MMSATTACDDDENNDENVYVIRMQLCTDIHISMNNIIIIV